MTQTLQEFIDAREAEIRAQMKALNDELRQLRAAKSAISGASTFGSGVVKTKMTQRDMIIAALNEHPDGGTTEMIVGWVKDKFDVDVAQPTMSSQLSRAKADGAVALDTSTKIWRLPQHSVKENEPPKGGSETGEGDASSDMQSETSQGLPSAHSPDPAGQTRHWKLPGT
ncbi:MAG: hypothetical protein ACP5DX_05630 [Paracoccaceae bacterium]